MASSFVQEKILSKKVVIFMKSQCPFCKLAKQVLQKYVGTAIKKSEYEEIVLDNNPDANKIQDYLKEITGSRSVPRVFIHGKFVGGGEDIEKLDKSNQLAHLF